MDGPLPVPGPRPSDPSEVTEDVDCCRDARAVAGREEWVDVDAGGWARGMGARTGTGAAGAGVEEVEGGAGELEVDIGADV